MPTEVENISFCHSTLKFSGVHVLNCKYIYMAVKNMIQGICMKTIIMVVFNRFYIIALVLPLAFCRKFIRYRSIFGE